MTKLTIITFVGTILNQSCVIIQIGPNYFSNICFLFDMANLTTPNFFRIQLVSNYKNFIVKLKLDSNFRWKNSYSGQARIGSLSIPQMSVNLNHNKNALIINYITYDLNYSISYTRYICLILQIPSMEYNCKLL